ncbi:hypothetical protein RCO28_16200 [Streptomyces sp. LHD-70]|uniref:hypothetical protein n=1 Tax=Streptomyces sp. LHD-70 TaxID=3072140 RepID=UPI00280DF8B3|nr:hypothetical protein [Streptomyces sp. LHD-70]MDQ8704021.1 hypothetical protein [Streptomyces sp. LHD-70]
MKRTTRHDHTAPQTGLGAGPPGASPQRGVTATVLVALRWNRGAVAGATARVVGLAGLVGLVLTGAIFALAWPLFTHMRNERIRYQQLEDPYLHDPTDLALLALCTLPLFLLLLGVGSAALQRVCSRAVAAANGADAAEGEAEEAEEARRPRTGGRAPWRPVLAVYALRGLVVWLLPLLVHAVADSLTGYHLDTPEPLERGSWPHALVTASPVVAVGVALLLRLGLTLAPAAAAAGLGPRAALRRSWSLTWTRGGLARVLALALPLAALTAGVLRLTVQLALPLRPLVRELVEQVTGNFFAAYYAGILAPVIVGILVTAALTLPLTYTAFAALHEQLRPARVLPRPAGETADSAP